MAHFFDALVNVSVTGPLIRLDFAVAQQTKTEDGQDAVRLTNIEQVVLPLDGFVRAFGLQQQVIQQLVNSGVLKQTDAATADQGVSQAASSN